MELPKLPTMYFAKSGNYTYARTYKNEWRLKKDGKSKQAVKTHIRKVGRIDNPEGLGRILFDREFYDLHPEFKNYRVFRKVRDNGKGSNGFALEIRPIDSDHPLR